MSVDGRILLPYRKKVSKPIKLTLNKITPKKLSLCQKYFYMDQSKQKINYIKFDNEKSPLEQVDTVITKLSKKRFDLENTKIDCIKSMILNNKHIPEKWIMKSNYKDLLSKAMEDDIVLDYAIACKDIHKKRAGYDDVDEDTKYLHYIKSLPKEKKFISYINPHSRNYSDSNKKRNLMKEYDKKYFKKFYKFPLITSNNNNYKKEDDKNYKEDDNKKRRLKEMKNTYSLTEGNETRNDLMVTSLHYTGLDNLVNVDDNRNKIELKLPEII